MKILLAILAWVTLSACDKRSRHAMTAPRSAPSIYPDGTVTIDSRQGGSFEITVMPPDLSKSWTKNRRTNKNSLIEFEIDGDIFLRVSTNHPITIQNLSEDKHSIVEFVDYVETSKFAVMGDSQSSVIISYNETSGSWDISPSVTKLKK